MESLPVNIHEKYDLIPGALQREIKNQLMPADRDAWIAVLKPNNFRLLSCFQVKNAAMQQIEIFESRRAPGPNHLRLYLDAQDSHIPTLILGEYAAVAHSAWQDKKPALPIFQAKQEIPIGEIVIKFPDELMPFPGVADLISQQKKLMYLTRPTSFILKETFLLICNGDVVKTKIFRSQFSPHEMFCHVTSPDEWSQAFPNLGINGLTLTNSEVHAKAHPELSFKKIGDG